MLYTQTRFFIRFFSIFSPHIPSQPCTWKKGQPRCLFATQCGLLRCAKEWHHSRTNNYALFNDFQLNLLSLLFLCALISPINFLNCNVSKHHKRGERRDSTRKSNFEEKRQWKNKQRPIFERNKTSNHKAACKYVQSQSSTLTFFLFPFLSLWWLRQYKTNIK